MNNDRSRSGAASSVLMIYVLASILNVVGNGLAGPAIAYVTKPLLMPALFVWVLLVATRPLGRTQRRLLLGMVFAWLGDLLLIAQDISSDGGVFFLLGLAAFFGMQVCFIAAFLGVPGNHLLRQGPVLALPLVAYWLVMNLMLQPGALRIPVLIYSVVLVGMAIAALDLVPRLAVPFGWRVFTGSVFFVISDSLIALQAFGGMEIGRWQGVLVMATYTIAQFLIVTGLIAGTNRPEHTPMGPGSTATSSS
ncbi:MAG: lysoplasmalogenase [Candidatus Nanopelagicales bacterium]|nr:lysoplasmalogenase [Candidatus Nanopelagicales bacterium]